MQLSTPCPRCQAPITLRQVLLATSPLHLKCMQCQVQLHLKPWAWGVTIIFFVAVLGAIGLFFYQRVASDMAVRGMLRITMLGFLVLAVVINLLMIQLRPFYVRDSD